MNEVFKQDWKRYSRTEWSKKHILGLFKNRTMRYILLGRISTSQNQVVKALAGGLQKYIGNNMGCEIGWSNIGPGIVLTHPFGITVNSNAKIGKNCTLFKGCTIGSIRGGGKIRNPLYW